MDAMQKTPDDGDVNTVLANDKLTFFWSKIDYLSQVVIKLDLHD